MMSLSLFCLFLILLQNQHTEQTTDIPPETTTDVPPETTTDVPPEPMTDAPPEQMTDVPPERTTDDTSSSSRNTEASSNIEDSTVNLTTTEQTIEAEDYANTTNKQPTTERIADSRTLSISTKSISQIDSRALPDDDFIESENTKSNDQEYKSYEKNYSSVSVFSIVLASLVGTIAIFYITVMLIKQYGRKTYTVRTPSMELGQA